MEKEELREKLENVLERVILGVSEELQGDYTETYNVYFSDVDTIKEEFLSKLEPFIQTELDRAKEEVEDKFRAKLKKREEEMNVPYSEEDGKDFFQGYQEGYHQGLQDMVVDTYYLDEEFQSKLTKK